MCRCNGEAELGSKALDDVLYRAKLELFPEALLVGLSYFCVCGPGECVFSQEQRLKKCCSISTGFSYRGEIASAHTYRMHVIQMHMLTCGLLVYSNHTMLLYVRVCRQCVIPQDYSLAFPSAALSCNP